MEAIRDLEYQMFEDENRDEWGLDMGTHQDEWNPCATYLNYMHTKHLHRERHTRTKWEGESFHAY